MKKFHLSFYLKILLIILKLKVCVKGFSTLVVDNKVVNLKKFEPLLNSSISSSFLNLDNIRTSSLRPPNLITKSNSFSTESYSTPSSNEYISIIPPKKVPLSNLKDFLVTKYNYMNQINAPEFGEEVIIKGTTAKPKPTYNDAEVAQSNLFTFLNLSQPTTTTEFVLENSIENPSFTAIEVTYPSTYTDSSHGHFETFTEPSTTNHYFPSNHLTYRPYVTTAGVSTATPIPYLSSTLKPISYVSSTTEKVYSSTSKPLTKLHSGYNTHHTGHHQHHTGTVAPVIYLTYNKDKKKKPKKPKKKKKKPHFFHHHGGDIIYQEHPAFEAVEYGLESLYNYFEDAFTDSVHYPLLESFQSVEVDDHHHGYTYKHIHKHEHKHKHKKKVKKKKKKKKKHKSKILIPILTEVDAIDSIEDRTIPSDKKNQKNKGKIKKQTKKHKRKNKRKIKRKNILKSKPTKKSITNKAQQKITTRSMDTFDLVQTATPSTLAASTKNEDLNLNYDQTQSTKNFITQIHVTSEYIEPSTSVPITTKKEKIKSDEESEEYYDFDFGIDFNSDDDDDEDIDRNENDVDKNESYEDNDDKTENNSANSQSDEKNDYYDDFDDFFYNPFKSSTPPRLLTLNFDSQNAQHESGRSTTPKMDYHYTKKPKDPIFIGDSNDLDDISSSTSEENNNGISWFPSFFGGGSDDNDENQENNHIIIPETTTQSQSWLNSWFGDDTTTTTVPPTDIPTTTVDYWNNVWWIPWFGNTESTTTSTTTTTTTPPPFIPILSIPNHIPKPEIWFNILNNYIKAQVIKKQPVENLKIPKNMLYKNYQLWRLFPESNDDLQALMSYRSSSEGSKLDWWKGPSLRGATDILIPPNMTELVKDHLDDESIKFEKVIYDIQTAIDYENPKLSKREKFELEKSQGHSLTWYRYHDYDDIVQFLEYLSRKYPNNIELIHIGRSYEGRPLIIAKVFHSDDEYYNWKNSKSSKKQIKYKHKKNPKKSSIFIEAGSHGREWISPAVATWILNYLTLNINKNTTETETLKMVDWYIMPVLNPDGYQYTHKYDRLWKKTRSKHEETGDFGILSNAINWIQNLNSDKEKFCYGVDPNRNWDITWNGDGGSHSKCSNDYIGPQAFSEPETKALSKFLMNNRKNLQIFLSLHSYGQLISFPTTTNSTYDSLKIDDARDMALIATKALREKDSSLRYTVDSNSDMLYTRSGSSDQFAMYEAGLKYSYTLQLRDTGIHGFLLPGTYINSTARDAFEMIQTMINYL